MGWKYLSKIMDKWFYPTLSMLGLKLIYGSKRWWWRCLDEVETIRVSRFKYKSKWYIVTLQKSCRKYIVGKLHGLSDIRAVTCKSNKFGSELYPTPMPRYHAVNTQRRQHKKQIKDKHYLTYHLCIQRLIIRKRYEEPFVEFIVALYWDFEGKTLFPLETIWLFSYFNKL